MSSRYVKRVDRALRSRRDSWGEQLLAAPNGPTYEKAQQYLTPLFLARTKNGRLLTRSGAHYTHFSQPPNLRGATSVALHVADGSQIISRRAHGRHLTVGVGLRGRELYGSCLRRLEAPTLAEGHLPILQTSYVDRHGVRYSQESFAVGSRRRHRSSASSSSLPTRAAEGRARAGSPDAVREGALTQGVEADARRTHLHVLRPRRNVRPPFRQVERPARRQPTFYAVWLHIPRRSDEIVLDELRYEEALSSLRSYWERRLAHGARVVVPEQAVMDAQRNLLIQNLALTWRYSVGNTYEQLSTPEGVDVARVLTGYGHLGVGRSILRTSLRKKPTQPKPNRIRRSTNWRMGARLVGFANYARLSGDRAEILRATPVLRSYVKRFERQLRASRYRLLQRERYSSDVSTPVFGLHPQTVVWQGLRSMGQVWEDTGYTRLAATCRRLSHKLEAGLRRAVAHSQRRLPGGALFLPVTLLDDVRPYGSLTASRGGSYWNLVMPYALASGFFEPHGPKAKGILAYQRRNGSRLLGRVRAGAYGLYGPAAYPKSGSSPVYGLNLARFLADNDQPDQLVLGLYGQLATEMTQGTFVSGESVGVAPLAGDHYRSTYLPPNGASNAAFLETLRLMLVHETTDASGAPRGLELAYSTPRDWLRPGQPIEVRKLPTSFGRVSFALESLGDSVRISLMFPTGRR